MHLTRENIKNSFSYKRRYEERPFTGLLQNWSIKLKMFFLKSLLKSPFKNSVDLADSYAIRHQNEAYFFDEGRIKYVDVILPKITFYEIFHIDEFHIHKKLLLRNFRDDHQGPFKKDYQKVQKSLDEIKQSLGTIIWNNQIVYTEFNRSLDDNLIKSASIGYIKTRESYFILTVEIKTSDTFQQIFKSIIDSDNYQIGTLQFNSLAEILRTGKFTRGTKQGWGSVGQNIHNLLSDLNFQVKKNITTRLRGNFNKLGMLPRLEYFEVENMTKFREDKVLSSIIQNHHNSYQLPDGQIQISLYSNNAIRIIKEKGHGKRPHSNSDLTDYDWLETFELMRGLDLPTGLRSILSMQSQSLTSLKRDVYDYISESGRKTFLQRMRILYWKRRYEKLKVKLAMSILTFKRLEEEFDSCNMGIYFHDYDLSQFLKHELKHQNTVTNLQEHFQKTFQNQVKKLNQDIATLEHIFKPIEDLHIYTINVWLQLSSVIIAILAFVVTFDKVIAIFGIVIAELSKLFNLR